MSRQVVTLLLGIVLTIAGLVAVASSARAASDPCATGGNPVACENSKPGTPASVWDIGGPGDASIQGFSTDISVNAGSRIDFKIDTDASAYTITIYRTGWYGGDGARQVATVTPSAKLPQSQPNCIWDVTTELTDCGNWAVSASWNVPSDAVSGVYIALLHRADKDDSSHITFIVRNDSSHSDIVFQTSDTTWQAYNDYGGSDFYKGAANGRSYKVSYNRPVMTRNTPGGQDFYFANEYPLVRFLERNGYDVSYMAGVDTDRYGSLIKNHKVFLSVGHDEYWSGAQRANVEAARDAGVNLQFLSGNEVYWRTRYEPSVDPSHTPYRTLVTYKEAWAQAKIDPSPQSTSTWRDPRYASQANGGGLPENALTGTIFMSNYTDLPLTVTKAQGKLRLWRNTGLSSMTSASTALAPHTVGYESDEDQDNGFRPAGLIDLSTTTGAISGQYMTDFGLTTGDGTTTHSLTLYKAPSGALVFGAGTVQWSWGLDDDHDTPYAYEPADPRMQQAQVNLLADMGAQPTTLMSGLTAATMSTDTTAPTVTITNPAAGSAQPNGSRVTVTGTASDTGGVVAGVEYSTDAGGSWHPAQGTTSWSFTYTQHGVGSASLQVRAVDDSANIGAPVSRTFSVACPCSVFGANGVPTTWSAVVSPATTATGDTSPVELGLRFTPLADGFVTGVRFYKGTGNTGTHTGTLWSASGDSLAKVTFTNETSTGWQSATFAQPVPVSAGQPYTVSYTAPNGHYAAQPWAFSEAGLDADPLQVQGGYGVPPAGVFGSVGTFPTNSWMNTNYFVDVLLTATDESPLIAMNQWPTPSSSSVPLSTTVSARYSKPVLAGSQSITVKDQLGNVVAGTTTYDASTRTITFTPTSLSGFVTYTVTLTGKDTQGDSLSSGGTWSFTTVKPPATPGVCPCSLFDDGDVPVMPTVTDDTPITLGVRFSSTQSGVVTAVKFYKSTANVGTHTGTLWSSGGTALATGTFSSESSSGWQTLTFAQPVSITAGTTYIASYYSPTGWYSATPNAFVSSDLSKGPLTVTSTSGAYVYGNGFPAGATATNYGVDLVFQKPTPTIAITSQQPAPGAVSVPRSSPVKVGFSAPIASGYSLTVKQGSTAIDGTTTLDATGTTLTFSPTALMPADADITVALSGVVSTDGATLAAQSWTFHTRTADSVDSQTMFGDVVPTTPAVTDDASPVELGTAFTPARDGQITALRFYKGTGNGGTHVGSLWSPSGGLLAQVTFTAETATGWQEATLPTPVFVMAGQTYVVSYLAPQGHYAVTSGFFSSAWTSGDLTAPANTNGRYLYGSAGGLPIYSYNATNYFVDVVFQRGSDVSIFGSDTPTTAAVNDNGAIEVGTAFTTSEAGSVTALRFYKGPLNTGTHVGSLWSSDGTRLASVTFTGETDGGWQRAVLPTPVALTPGATYVVSYFAPNGHYAATSGYFSSPKVSGPLTGLATGNGRYLYSATGGYPTDSFNATSYFVDVEFLPGATGTSSPTPTPTQSPTASPTTTSPSPTATTTATTSTSQTPVSETTSSSPTTTSTPTSTATATTSSTPAPLTIVSRNPASGATSVSRSVRPSATMSAPLAAGTIRLLRGSTPVSGTSVLSADQLTLTFTPSSALARLTTYTVQIVGATSTTGATLSTQSWSFRTSS